MRTVLYASFVRVSVFVRVVETNCVLSEQSNESVACAHIEIEMCVYVFMLCIELCCVWVKRNNNNYSQQVDTGIVYYTICAWFYAYMYT